MMRWNSSFHVLLHQCFFHWPTTIILSIEFCEDGSQWTQGSSERAENISSNHRFEVHFRISTCSFSIGRILKIIEWGLDDCNDDFLLTKTYKYPSISLVFCLLTRDLVSSSAQVVLDTAKIQVLDKTV